MLNGKKRPLCKCGCGKKVTWSKYYKRWNMYLKGHHHKNKKVSEETKKKISDAVKKRGFFKEYNKTKEHKLKVIASNKNRNVTKETKKKISNSLIGFKHSEETKSKIKCSRFELIKEKAPNWKGGVYKYTTGWVKLRPEIKERDNNKCIYCKTKRNLHVHHINENKKDIRPMNLVTLCGSCHSYLHPKGFVKPNKLKIHKIKQKIKKHMQTLPIIKSP